MTLSARENKVCDLIRSRERALLDDLRLHVGLPTGGRNIPALDETRERLTRRAAALGASVKIKPGASRPEWLYGETPGQAPLPTAVCRRSGVPTGGRDLLIVGHLDTVHDPAGPFRELSIAPDARTATGPGCVDMKGGLVIALAALEALEESRERLNWTLLLNSDEETGSFHSAPAIHEEAAHVAASGGLGIALEPATADGGLVIERAGSAQFMIEVRGKSAHVGRDFASGVSAVYHLSGLIQMVLTMHRHSKEATPGDPIINIGPLQGGAATNIVPDLARAWGNLRFSRKDVVRDFEHQLGLLTKNIDTYFPEQGHAEAEFKLSIARPAKPLTPEVQHFADLVRSCAADLNQPLPFSKTAGVCDGNLMQAASGGLPTLDTLGVRGGGLHTAQEWIDLSSLVQRCQLLAVTMMRASAGI